MGNGGDIEVRKISGRPASTACTGNDDRSANRSGDWLYEYDVTSVEI
jgi:hypothetical protein